jgi:hypothetical protein
MATDSNKEIVVDRGKWEWSEMWKKEDWWAIWLGFIILAVGCMIFLPRPPADMDAKLAKAEATMASEASRAPFQTVAWHQANDSKSGVRATSEPHARTLKTWLDTPSKWKDNPVAALYLSEADAAKRREAAEPKHEAAKEKTKAALAEAKAAEEAAAEANFQSAELNDKAEAAIAAWRKARGDESKARTAASVKAYNKIPYLLGLMVILGLFFAIGTLFMNIDTGKFLMGFGFVFALAVVAEIIGGQSTLSEYGFGSIIWAIFGGMLISNTVGTPKFMMPALQTEYFIKTGLVLLGAEILFSKIVAIGIPGVFVAWVVTPTVLILTFMFGQRVLKMESKTLNITVSADMSVCGVSAAIATAAACRATKEELTIAIGLSPWACTRCLAAPGSAAPSTPPARSSRLARSWARPACSWPRPSR